MSTNSMEKALWVALSNSRELRRLREDPPAYLGEFNIDDEERALILKWDVSEIVARGVSPLLLLSVFSGVNGVRRMPEYLAKINQPLEASSGR